MSLITANYTDLFSGTLTGFSLPDLALSFIWILVFTLFLSFYRSGKKDTVYSYFIPFFFFKILMGLSASILYVLIYGGGDITAYWSTSNSLVELLYQDGAAYWKEIWSTSENASMLNELWAHNIRYPGWIVREPESYLVAKIASLINLISFQNFLLCTLWFSFISFLVHWRFFLFIKRYFSFDSIWFNRLFLFFPSVAFWCSGISKDTLVFIGLLLFIQAAFELFLHRKWSFKNFLFLIVSVLILVKIRNVAFAIVALSFGVTFALGWVSKIRQTSLRWIVRVSVVLVGVGAVFSALAFTSASDVMNNYLNEAAVIQQDFQSNTAYSGKKYSIGLTDFSAGGMLVAAPLAILAGIFRPFIWEALSPLLLLNGIESVMLLYLVLKLFTSNFKDFWASLSKEPLVLFALIFVLLFAFATGLTAVLFGVLVRLRAPLLLFMIIILYVSYLKKHSTINTSSINE